MAHHKLKTALCGLLASIACVGGPLLPAVAQEGATPASVIAFALRKEDKVPFTGTRSQQVIRQDMVLHANADVTFENQANYQIILQAPKEIKGLNLMLSQNKLTAYFPQETLLFQSDSAAGSAEIKDLIMGKLSANPKLLARNYQVSLDPQTDIVALYPCYKLNFTPIHGLGANSPPGRRIWVSKETGQIMKEERYWSANTAAYFISQYDNFSTQTPPAIHLSVPHEVTRLQLSASGPTSMQSFSSVEAARAAGKDVYAPNSVPPGFQLNDVDVLSLYGADIVIERFTDGLNNLVVTYRPKPNAFLTLVAGAFALGLVDKISQLSYHAPNNYAVVPMGNDYVYAYGDLWVDALKQVASSVPLPISKAQGLNAPAIASR
jgi:outer membrane lipoprotein-sorting protein